MAQNSDNREFPKSPCYICGIRIKDVTEGFLAFDNFALSLERLEEQGKRDFVSRVSRLYFLQFGDLYRQQYGEVVDLRDMARDLVIDDQAHAYRFKKVVENPPDKFLVILTHDNCYPEAEIGDPAYWIPLEEIGSERKALDWTFHLNEKTWLNREAWIDTLEAMFGRKPV